MGAKDQYENVKQILNSLSKEQKAMLAGCASTNLIVITGGDITDRKAIAYEILKSDTSFRYSEHLTNHDTVAVLEHFLKRQSGEKLIICNNDFKLYRCMLTKNLIRIKIYKNENRPLDIHFIPVVNVSTKEETKLMKINFNEDKTNVLLTGFDSESHKLQITWKDESVEPIYVNTEEELSALISFSKGRQSYLTLTKAKSHKDSNLPLQPFVINLARIEINLKAEKELRLLLTTNRALGMPTVVTTPKDFLAVLPALDMYFNDKVNL